LRKTDAWERDDGTSGDKRERDDLKHALYPKHSRMIFKNVNRKSSGGGRELTLKGRGVCYLSYEPEINGRGLNRKIRVA